MYLTLLRSPNGWAMADALEKAVELKLIDSYCLGDLTDRQARAWLRETAEAMPGGSAR